MCLLDAAAGRNSSAAMFIEPFTGGPRSAVSRREREWQYA